MRKKLYKILVTGGAGFIGSAFVRLLLTRDSYSQVRGCLRQSNKKALLRELSPRVNNKVIVVDKLTYAGDLAKLKKVQGKYKFYKADISEKKHIEPIFKKERPDIVVNFSAETHVDRSILDSRVFIQTNVIGTQVLLDLSRKYKIKQFIHLSTDEVYGDIEKGKFTEESPLRPNSPYAVSKASADLLINSYVRTYGFPAVIIRPCNNYGPWQYPEKLIPLAVLKILRNEKIPLYADGRNRREWLYVEDCAEGILKILKKGRIGRIYNLGSGFEMENITVAGMLLKILDKESGMVEFVKDRPGHDIRYSLDSSKVRREIEWSPKFNFRDGLKLTVEWYLGHKDWLLSKWSKVSSLYKQR